MTQPNEQLIETIEKALEPFGRSIPNIPSIEAARELVSDKGHIWLRALLEENKRITKERDDAREKFERATLARSNAVQKHQKVTFQLQQTREELEQWKKHANDIEEMYKVEHRSKNEANRVLEQVKAEREELITLRDRALNDASKYEEMYEENRDVSNEIIQSLRIELSAKDKVLEWIVDNFDSVKSGLTDEEYHKQMLYLGSSILDQYRSDTK